MRAVRIGGKSNRRAISKRDDEEKLLVVTEVLRQEVDVLDRPEFSVKVLILT